MHYPLLVIYAYLNIVEPDGVGITHARGTYKSDPGVSRDVDANVLAVWFVARIGAISLEMHNLVPGGLLMGDPIIPIIP